MTTKHYFTNILNMDLFIPASRPGEKKKRRGKLPDMATLTSLSDDNLALIAFINDLSPFQSKMKTLLYQDEDACMLLRSAFPLSDAMISQLDAECAAVVLEQWKDGIAENIRQHHSSLVGPYGAQLLPEQLVFVFAEPIAALTEHLFFPDFHDDFSLFDDEWGVTSESFLLDISLRAAQLTSDLHPAAKKQLDSHFLHLFQAVEYSEQDIALYQTLQYKPLDERVHQTLVSGSLSDVWGMLVQIHQYRLFMDLPASTILHHLKPRIPYFLKDLEQARLDFDKAPALKQTPRYRQGTEDEREQIESQIHRAYNAFDHAQSHLRFVIEFLMENV